MQIREVSDAEMKAIAARPFYAAEPLAPLFHMTKEECQALLANKDANGPVGSSSGRFWSCERNEWVYPTLEPQPGAQSQVSATPLDDDVTPIGRAATALFLKIQIADLRAENTTLRARLSERDASALNAMRRRV